MAAQHRFAQAGVANLLQLQKRLFGAQGQLAADACRDAGENAMAAKAELAGKAAMLLLSLPLFEKVAELAASLIGGTGAGG